MSDIERNWKYGEDFPIENEHVRTARQHSLEEGIDPVSPAVGAHLAALTASSAARNVIEIGTGLGVSGLHLLRGAPRATLTSIDVEFEYQQSARRSFAEAGIGTARVRLITERALQVLPRMNDGSYDVVFIDADPQSVIEYVEHGLRLARVGGTVLVAHALWRGRVADPAQRDDTAVAFRTLLGEVAASPAVVTSLSTAGDGLLQLTRVD